VSGGDAGDLGVVVGGRDFDDAGADQLSGPNERSVASSPRLAPVTRATDSLICMATPSAV
jgi:hypothetical protein